jgi:hypothetical protein
VRLADAEGVLHGRCSLRNYSTAPEAAETVRQPIHRRERSPIGLASDPLCRPPMSARAKLSRCSIVG